jgi:hypothetical protein
MVHLRQHHFGKVSRPGYHNKEWAQMMKEIGLYPSSTGEVGGKEVGQTVSHYIIKGGRFAVACAELLKSGCNIAYVEVLHDAEAEKKKRESKTKFTCSKCGMNVWGKPDVEVTCTKCQLPMEAEE